MDLMARRRAIMGMPSGKDYTVSGNVVSVSNALAKNAKSLVVSFSPKQSGSGDPSPDNVRPISGYNDIGAVRYGKNLWSMTACVGCSYNPAQGTVFDTTPATLQPTDNGDGSFSVTISSWGRVCFIVPVPNGASVRVKYSRSGAGGRRTIGWLDADKKVIGSNNNNTDANENYSGTWTASGGAKYLFFIFTSNTASTQTITYPQVEIGNTATSYEPYVSPVTANVHVGGAGKNKLDQADYTSIEQGTSYTNGTFSSTNASVYSGTIVRLYNGNTTVQTITASNATEGARVAIPVTFNSSWNKMFIGYRTQGTYNVGAYYSKPSLPDGNYIVSFLVIKHESGNYSFSDIQLEAGSSATTYGPYSIFGGTVDLVSGECVVTHQLIDLTDNTWNYYAPSGKQTFNTTIVGLLEGGTGVCDRYKFENVQYISQQADKTFYFYKQNATQNRISIRDDAYSDATSFRASVAGMMVVYPLATPITYTLTPSQLALLKGNNTVYSNEGSISLTYVGK